jgi:hypothetical protein
MPALCPKESCAGRPSFALLVRGPTTTNAAGASLVAIALARCGAVSNAKAITSVMLDFRARGVFRVMLAEIRRA